VAHQLSDHPVAPIQIRDTVYATCLVTDAENFTPLSETLLPEQTAAHLNAYFAELSRPVEGYGADFREFHADGMLAAWIADGPGHASRERACLAAIEAVKAIDAFNARNRLHLGVRIGLHAGEVFLGTIGAGGRLGFQLVGDIVNTASRIEGLNKHLGTRVLASEAVVAGLDTLLLRPVGNFRLKGKQSAVPIVELVATRAEASAVLHARNRRFAGALSLLQQGQLASAIEAFAEMAREEPEDGASRFYIEHCRTRLAAAAGVEDPAVISLDRK
jgi:adenylate cyclase